MLKVLMLTFMLLAAAFLLLGVKVLWVKGARFPLGHHGHNAPRPRIRKP